MNEIGLLTYIRDFFTGGIVTSAEVTDEEFYALVAEINIRELAFWSCINMIANSVSKCELKTFVGGKEIKGPEYYKWNVSPNKNQNSSAFMHKLISQLYRFNECLVIEENGQLLVADSFQQTEYALVDNIFEGVTVGNYTFATKYRMSDVMYFKLGEKDMRKVTNAIYESYGKLITYGMTAYQKSRGSRGILNYKTLAQGNEAAKAAFDDLMNNRFKKFFTAENAVLPLPDGYTYTDTGSKTYSNEGTRDIRSMMDDISDFTAKSVGIPPALAKGDIAGIGDALISYLTFCVDPLVDNIAEEINRKRYGFKEFSKGNYLKIDTKSILHVDLLSVSVAIDKLIASGAFCINDIRKLVGEEIIDEPWAWQHFLTKNYSSIDDVLNALNSGVTP
ncbi:MAG TPA: phage portal protein [Desulfosporosinus sp.]|nr:phage portal protein [Desulfosporosinus sp.]